MHFDDFINMAKLTINELEHRLLETFKTSIQQEKKKMQEKKTQELWDSFRRCNIHINGRPEERIE